MTDKLKEKIKKIKVLAMDVDGVLTNGKIVLDNKGNELKYFDVQDGYGIAVIRRAGIKTAIISARSAGAVTSRAADLNIDKVFQDAYPKTVAYSKLLKELKVSSDEVCFVGDDLPDIVLLEKVGFAVAVKNAASEVKRSADYVTKKQGGDGAIREVVELILKTQGKWKNILN
ncbi:MAG: HAD-IIIA family hydrolase [Candidatus Omnitrophica bacterium]|nr:HAD-IIIA family hydrolase [Candidatus Omnitrophota bacterium]MBU1995792.1 HAD-IIIA family hydrolase [Candidatus Omnitrophota bacterium]MBU4334720.1 HAD-IIIA family hydrolase [Candidatus Omnitrophota bacterium]